MKTKEPTTTAPAPEPAAPIKYEVKRGLRVPLDKIRVVSNTRTEFGGPEDDDLLASVKVHGVLAPLWLRQESPTDTTYILIAGERRFRAALAAGLPDAPADLYLCDRKTAGELQIIENLQRKDISEIDEARGFKALLQEHGYTIDQLIAKLGKSKSYIYGRIKLADAPQLGLEALAAKTISPSILLRVVRIPGREQQMEALQEILTSTWLQTERAAADFIQREYARELKGAPFDPEDPTLNPKFGKCSGCDFRSGNQGDLFPDSGGGRADICTNTACFEQKCRAGSDKRFSAQKADGLKALEGKAAEAAGLNESWLTSKSPFIRLDDPAHEYAGKKTFRQLLGDKAPALTLLRKGPGEPIMEVVDKSALADALKAGGHKKKPVQTYERKMTPAEKAAQEARALEQAETEAVCTAIAAAAADKIEMGTITTANDRALWLVAVGQEIGACFYGTRKICERREIKVSGSSHDAHAKALRAFAKSHKCGVTELQALFVELVLHNDDVDEDDSNALCKLLGVDPHKIEKETRLKAQDARARAAADASRKSDKKAKPAPAKPAAKTTGGGGAIKTKGRRKMSPEAMARIAAAQRARWAAARKGGK